MKKSLLVSAIALTFVGAASSLFAGPGIDYFKRMETVSASAKAARETTDPATTSKCKVSEVIQVTTGPHGLPIRNVIRSCTDCADCRDGAMSCCAGKAKA